MSRTTLASALTEAFHAHDWSGPKPEISDAQWAELTDVVMAGYREYCTELRDHVMAACDDTGPLRFLDSDGWD